MSEYLQQVKEGDEVALRTGYTYGSHHICKVERVTRTQIIVRGSRFRRDDGSEVGNNTWGNRRLTEPTPKIREEIRRRAIVKRLAEVNWNALDASVLDAVVALLPPVEALGQ